MKKLTLLISTLLLATMAWAAGNMQGQGHGNMKGMQMFQTVPVDKAEILQTGEDKMYCPNCGMHLPKFYKTGHAVKLKDGTTRQYCSIHCLVEELELAALRGKKADVKETLVVDVESGKFTDATQAHYVIGSKIGGTMTMNSKYAFASKTSADKFAAENGGKVVTFDEAYDIALNDFASDMAMVHKKRSGKMWKMGQKIYEGQCDQQKVQMTSHAHTMGEMKAAIAKSGACGDLNDMQLQAVMLYVWDVKMNKFEETYGKNPEIQKKIKAMQ